MRSTTSTLLDGLDDPRNRDAWERLDRRFRPILVGICRRAGLSDDDAADVAQETLVDFFRSRKKYQRDRRLRSWMVGILRNKIRDHMRSQFRRSRQVADVECGVAMLQVTELQSLWETECQRRLLLIALSELPHCSRLKRQTINAFKAVAIERLAPEAVARQLGMTVQSVYMAKHRCLLALREQTGALMEMYGVGALPATGGDQ